MEAFADGWGGWSFCFYSPSHLGRQRGEELEKSWGSRLPPAQYHHALPTFPTFPSCVTGICQWAMLCACLLGMRGGEEEERKPPPACGRHAMYSQISFPVWRVAGGRKAAPFPTWAQRKEEDQSGAVSTCAWAGAVLYLARRLGGTFPCACLVMVNAVGGYCPNPSLQWG